MPTLAISSHRHRWCHPDGGGSFDCGGDSSGGGAAWTWSRASSTNKRAWLATVMFHASVVLASTAFFQAGFACAALGAAFLQFERRLTPVDQMLPANDFPGLELPKAAARRFD